MENVEQQVAELQNQLAALQGQRVENKLSMVVFSGDLDKVLASMVIATGAVAMGMEVVMFFTFWGTPVLRDANKSVGGKDMMGKMFGAMLPKGTGQVKLSKMNMGGMGTMMMKNLMQKKKRCFPGGDVSPGRGTRRPDHHLRDVHGPHGLQARGNDQIRTPGFRRRGQIHSRSRNQQNPTVYIARPFSPQRLKII